MTFCLAYLVTIPKVRHNRMKIKSNKSNSRSMPNNLNALTNGLIQKDPETFRFLYRQYAGMITGHVRKNNGSEEDAKEVLQIVMMQLWRAVKDGRYVEEGKFDQYLYQLAANTWREELRRRRNRPVVELDAYDINVEDKTQEQLLHALAKDHYLEAMHKGLSQLEPPCNRIIELFHLQQVSLQKVAEEMEYNYDNLRKRIFDCRKKLKKIVEKILDNSTLK